jgi:hypothetical protein
MKAVLAILLAACFIAHCDRSSVRNKNDISTHADARANPTEPKETPDQFDVPNRSLENALKRERLKLNLENLKESRLSSTEAEFRFCVGFGLLFPRCFIKKTNDGRELAFYVGSRDARVAANIEAVSKVIARKFVVGPPKSGWGSFEAALKAHGVSSPLALKSDLEHAGDPDEEMFIVEQKTGEVYSLSYYPLNTQSEDGRKVIALCRVIEEEFGLKLGCTNP